MKNQQSIFTQTYCDSLLLDIKSGYSLNKYLSPVSLFEYTDKDLCYLPDFRVDQDKLRKINQDLLSNLEVGKLLFEAFPDLTPLLAAYDPFWVYLSHVELFEYLRKKWTNIECSSNGIEKPKEKQIEYIREYWFHSGSAIRSWLSGLWWSVYMTIEPDSTSPYELTEILFKQEDLRTRTFGTYTIFRHKAASKATLRFIKDNEALLEHSFQDKCRFISKRLNLIGGSRQVAFLDEADFAEILNRMKPEIESKFNK